MANIKFSYLYRDGANYKNFKDVVFANPDNVDVMGLEALVRTKLIDGMWFCVDEWSMPDLHFGDWDNNMDHTWHEFEGLEYTDEVADSVVGLGGFIEVLRSTGRRP